MPFFHRSRRTNASHSHFTDITMKKLAGGARIRVGGVKMRVKNATFITVNNYTGGARKFHWLVLTRLLSLSIQENL